MGGSTAAIITIPIIAFLAVLGWVSLVLYGDRHGQWKHKGQPPRSEVAGGCFHATDGGRQLMPIPGQPPPEIPLPRAAAPQETYQTADVERTHSASSQEAAPQAEESQRAGSGLPPRLRALGSSARARRRPPVRAQQPAIGVVISAHLLCSSGCFVYTPLYCAG